MKRMLAPLLFLLFLISIPQSGTTQEISDGIITYNGLEKGEFLKSWHVIGPARVFLRNSDASDVDTQKKVFDEQPIPFNKIVPGIKKGWQDIKGKFLEWYSFESHDDIIDLKEALKDRLFVFAYAYAEVVMPEQQEMLLGIGSDDAVKIWLNGELVHDRWASRTVTPDEDLVTVTFKKGKNTLLLRVQNRQYDWGFVLRPVGPEHLSGSMVEHAGRGNLDAVEKALSIGADINSVDVRGLTAYNTARLNGRTEMAELLKKQGADITIPMPPIEDMVDAFFSDLVPEDGPAVTILVSKEGQVLFEQAYGLANQEEMRFANKKTTFRIGSVTKQFTASGILKLIEMGKLSLDDKLSKFVPDFPRGDEVTVHHLLTHISGINSYTGAPDFISQVTEYKTPDEMVETISPLGYEFDPGENWRYNNSGYYLLGYIIEQISGLEFDTFLEKHFFEPLGMKNTGVYVNGMTLPDEALGYSYSNGDIILALDWDMSQAGGAGNLYSNVYDLYLWNEGVFSGKVLTERSLKKAFTGVRLNNGELPNTLGGDSRYGYGWAIAEYRGVEVISHGGGLNGFNTDLSRYPDHDLTVTVLCNCVANYPGIYPGALSRRTAELFLWDKLDPQESYRTKEVEDKSVYDDYVGRYDYRNATATVTRDGDRLYIQLAGQPNHEVFPRDEDEFYWKVVEASVEFVRDENGHVIHGMHTQNGRTMKVIKLPDEDPETVDVSEEIFDRYVGDYQLAPNFILSISRKGDRFYSKATGQSQVEMFAESETKFFFKVVNAQIEFLQDPAGKVTHLVLYQNGEHTAQKIK